MSLQESDINENVDVIRNGEYSRNGDFHRNLDPNWSYYPIYVNKIELIDEILRRHGAPKGKTLDAGCGEGVLVEKYSRQGWDIVGFDKNYTSQYVRYGLMNEIPFDGQSFDNVLCLDVLEHLLFPDQPVALMEMKRVLRLDGRLILSVPNLGHFASRLKFLFSGKLLRTASIDHHLGDRPFSEYQKLLDYIGFEVEACYGIFPTVPLVYGFVRKNPAKSAGLLRTLRKLPLPVSWNFQTIFVCRPVY